MDYGKEIEAGKTKDTCRLRQIREQVHEEVGRSRKAGEINFDVGVAIVGGG